MQSNTLVWSKAMRTIATAGWMIANNLTSEKMIPNFRDYIYTKGLEEIGPGSVNIIS